MYFLVIEDNPDLVANLHDFFEPRGEGLDLCRRLRAAGQGVPILMLTARDTDPTLPECPQMKIVRIDGSLFYGAVNYVAERLRGLEQQAPEQSYLAIIASGVNFIDVAGAELLVQEAQRRRAAGGTLYLLRVKEEVRDFLDRGGYLQELGEENVFASKGAALRAIYQRLGAERCTHCTRRIFQECADRP